VKESNHNLLYFQLQNNEYFYSGVTIVLCSFFINCDLSYLHWMANFKYFVSFKIQNTVIVLFKYIFFHGDLYLYSNKIFHTVFGICILNTCIYAHLMFFKRINS